LSRWRKKTKVEMKFEKAGEKFSSSRGAEDKKLKLKGNLF